MAHRQWKIRAAALQGKLLLLSLVHVKRMMKEEQDQFKVWRMRFLGETNDFKEDSMEVDAFRVDEWSG